MKYKASIDIMPHKELLDPQGKTVAKNMHNVDIQGVESVRIGKRIEIVLESSDEQEANRVVEDACRKLLVNMIMETYAFTISPMVEESA